MIGKGKSMIGKGGPRLRGLGSGFWVVFCGRGTLKAYHGTELQLSMIGKSGNYDWKGRKYDWKGVEV